MKIRGAKGPITNVAEWFENAPPKGKEKQWKDGRSAKEVAKAWCPEGRDPEVPAELVELLRSGPLGAVQVLDVEVEAGIRFDAFPGEPRNADLAITAVDENGRVAISIEAKADEPFGDRVEKALIDAVRRIGKDENSNAVARVQGLASRLLPPWSSDLPHLGDLRYQLLTGVAGALAHAESIGASRAVFVVHELVDLEKTKESARRKNREDLDRFLTRMTAGKETRLRRGVLSGPHTLPGFPDIALYVGKARRDL